MDYVVQVLPHQGFPAHKIFHYVPGSFATAEAGDLYPVDYPLVCHIQIGLDIGSIKLDIQRNLPGGGLFPGDLQLQSLRDACYSDYKHIGKIVKSFSYG